MAEKAVATKGIGIALEPCPRTDADMASPCRRFGLGETCFRCSLTRDKENEMIADLLAGLTRAQDVAVRPE